MLLAEEWKIESAPALLVKAMAQLRLGQADQARSTYAQAKTPPKGFLDDLFALAVTFAHA